jgi:hypothetical protein
VLAVGAVGTVLAIAWAALQVAGVLGHKNVSESMAFPPGVQRVEVRVDVGWIVVRGHEGSTISGTRHLSSGFSAPQVDESVQGDTLRISAECRDPAFWACAVSYELSVPRGVAVDVHSRSGHVSVEGLDGRVVAGSDAGPVLAHDLGGEVDLRSSAGPIDGFELHASRLSARSSAGGVNLSFVEPPGSLTARSSAGTVNIGVPRRGAPYRVEASSSTGGAFVDVDTDPASDRVISATTSAGMVSIWYTDD